MTEMSIPLLVTGCRRGQHLPRLAFSAYAQIASAAGALVGVVQRDQRVAQDDGGRRRREEASSLYLDAVAPGQRVAGHGGVIKGEPHWRPGEIRPVEDSAALRRARGPCGCPRVRGTSGDQDAARVGDQVAA
jgi:hypothetical protein